MARTLWSTTVGSPRCRSNSEATETSFHPRCSETRISRRSAVGGRRRRRRGRHADGERDAVDELLARCGDRAQAATIGTIAVL
jgi:NaMN:DMB phosphoribosyltransferase